MINFAEVGKEISVPQNSASASQ